MEKLNSNAFTEYNAMCVNSISLIYESYHNQLFDYGKRFTSDRELLKDCIHAVFAKIFIRPDNIGGIKNMRSYLFVSLRNKLFDEIKRNSRLSDTAVDEIHLLSGDDIENRFIEMENNMMGAYKIECLLGRLTPRERKALTLYYIEEMKYEDICKNMNLGYQSVRNLVYRAKTKLRHLYDKTFLN